MTKEQDDYATKPDVFPQKGTSGSGDAHAYTVQARMAYFEPKQICGHLLDTRWRTIYFEQSPVGVPAQSRYSPWSGCLPGMMTYEAAQALRWWFMANAAHTFDHFCLETRLVKHEIKYSFEEQAVSAGALVDSRSRDIAEPPPVPKTAAAVSS